MFVQETSKLLNGYLKVVLLEGSPFERGLTHGRVLKKEIHKVIGKWRTHLETDYKLGADEFTERFFEKTDFLQAIERWTPGLLEEVRGVADGAGIDFRAALLFNLLDEVWANAEGVAGEHCSGVGVNKQGERPAMIAQNMDINGFYDGYQTLLHIKYPNSDLETLVFTCAGLIALTGMSNRPVGVTVNTLSQLAYSADGLPVAFVIRGLLEQKSQKDAVEFLHNVKHASGQNYLIGGEEGVYDFEASANKVSRYLPSRNAGVVCHTNHPLVNDDYTVKFRDKFRHRLMANDVGSVASGSSDTRFRSLEQRLGDKVGSLDIDALRSALTSRDSDQFPVCVNHQSESAPFTFGSVIMVLSEKPELQLAVGPPNKTKYRTFSFAPHSAVT